MHYFISMIFSQFSNLNLKLLELSDRPSYIDQIYACILHVGNDHWVVISKENEEICLYDTKYEAGRVEQILKSIKLMFVYPRDRATFSKKCISIKPVSQHTKKNISGYCSLAFLTSLCLIQILYFVLLQKNQL